MKRLLISIALFMWANIASAQDTPPLLQRPIFVPPTATAPARLFPASPTLQQIAAALGRSGAPGIEPVRIVQELIAWGPTVVPVLVAVLTPDTLMAAAQLSDSGKVTRASLPNRVLAVYALDGIGSCEAYATIIQVGANHADVEIRGASLNVLANSYLDKVKFGALKADTGAVHMLLKHADDPQEIPSFRRLVAQIARDGIRRWLDWDLGTTLQNRYSLVIDKTPTVMSSTDYWDYWWSLNRAKLLWSANSGKFQIAN